MTYNSNNLKTQTLLLFDCLMLFFNQENNMQKMTKIINGESSLSLRIIDWFVTNFSKKNDVAYKNPMNDKKFKVYNEYKLKLKAYGKVKFDPFCRWSRIMIPYDNEHYIETTIGQLNFFKWFIENNLLFYIEENYEKIDADMNLRNSTSKRKKTGEVKPANEQGGGGGANTNETKLKTTITRKKRVELSVSANKSLKIETTAVVLSF